MSQITRCPSCTTKFKVVADQLRISDGWVRCGQCKEIFDASAHLLPSEAQALLPDVSMTAARPLPTPVARATDAGRAWGAPNAAGNPAASSAPSMPPTGAHDVSWDSPAPDAVLDVPVPVVPAFLATGTTVGPSQGKGATPQPASPFAWWSSGVSAEDADLAPIGDAVTPATPIAAGESPNEDLPAAQMHESPVGYELPSAELDDTEWPEEFPGGNSTSAAGALHPPAELLRKQSVEDPATSDFGDVLESAAAQAQAQEDGPERVPDASFDEPSSPETLSSNSASDIGPGDSLEGNPRDGMPQEQEEDDLPGEAFGADEMSFVRAAKRKAFWRRPVVRAGLGGVLIVLSCTLALQAVLQERDRIAAVDPRFHSWLQMLCEPFQCALAPLRQISDVMIDSSSFHKGRGDSYQLTFAIKNRATVPLAMPAMELTLTDVQDQPVLRRVFLPQEMAAPTELPALGEWAASVAVIVTTGGSRVAGYRLLAFYP